VGEAGVGVASDPRLSGSGSVCVSLGVGEAGVGAALCTVCSVHVESDCEYTKTACPVLEF
jgi:hypothetical protein